jgi:hypothetical protein
MAVLSADEHVKLLKRAEIQFRLMVAVRTASTLGTLPLQVPVVFTFGKRTVTSADVKLTRDEADEGAAVLEHTATYTLAMQIVQAMKDVLQKPREHKDQEVRHAFEMARLIRNAYAHQPFRPHWSIDPDCANKVFEVAGIARVETANLSGQAVRWQDYGGMLALFRLSHYVRSVIYPSEAVPVRREYDSDYPVKVPRCKLGDVIQQGRMLMIVLDKLPDGAKGIEHDGPIELKGPDGTYKIVPAETRHVP